MQGMRFIGMKLAHYSMLSFVPARICIKNTYQTTESKGRLQGADHMIIFMFFLFVFLTRAPSISIKKTKSQEFDKEKVCCTTECNTNNDSDPAHHLSAIF